MNTWATHSALSHPWFSKLSMKRKFAHSNSASSSAPSSTHASQTGSDSDSPGQSAAAAAAHSSGHRAKRRRYAGLEHGLAHLSLDNLVSARQNIGPTGIASELNTRYSVSPQSASFTTSTYEDPTFALSITEIPNSGYDPYKPSMATGSSNASLAFPNPSLLPPSFEEEVLRPAQVEEPEPQRVATPPIREVRMRSAGWYEPEPDRIVITDLDDLSESEGELDADEPSVSLPESVRRALAARTIGPAINPRFNNPIPNASQALVLFRPLRIPPIDSQEPEPEPEIASVDMGISMDTIPAPSVPEQGMVIEDDDAMDVEP